MASTGEAAQSNDRATGQRYHQLDALRGVAALTVVVSHAAVIVPSVYAAVIYRGQQDGALWWWFNTPAAALWSGPQAVTLFFVLSGFVLALPFTSGRRAPRYGDFMLRRWCRLWPPYMAAIVVALLVRYTLGEIHVAGLSGWFRDAWGSPLTGEELANHATMLLKADDNQSTPVLWSLAVEFRIALVFPVLVWVTRRWQWTTLAATLLLAAAVAPLSDLRDGRATFLYLPTFVLGIQLALHRDSVTRLGRQLTGVRLAALLAVALVLYTSPSTLLYRMPANSFVPTVMVAAACALLVALAIGSVRVAAALCCRPLLFLGRISYSLYLVHTTVILGLVHAAGGRVPLWLLLPVAVLLSIPVAWVGHRWVEAPSMRLGRTLSATLAAVRGRSPEADEARAALFTGSTTVSQLGSRAR